MAELNASRSEENNSVRERSVFHWKWGFKNLFYLTLFYSCRREAAHLARSLRNYKLDPIVPLRWAHHMELCGPGWAYGLAPGQAGCSPRVGSLSSNPEQQPVWAALRPGQTLKNDKALTLHLGGVLWLRALFHTKKLSGSLGVTAPVAWIFSILFDKWPSNLCCKKHHIQSHLIFSDDSVITGISVIESSWCPEMASGLWRWVSLVNTSALTLSFLLSLPFFFPPSLLSHQLLSWKTLNIRKIGRIKKYNGPPHIHHLG